MKIHIDIRNDISPTIALECVKQVIIQGKVSASGKLNDAYNEKNKEDWR